MTNVEGRFSELAEPVKLQSYQSQPAVTGCWSASDAQEVSLSPLVSLVPTAIVGG